MRRRQINNNSLEHENRILKQKINQLMYDYCCLQKKMEEMMEKEEMMENAPSDNYSYENDERAFQDISGEIHLPIHDLSGVPNPIHPPTIRVIPPPQPFHPPPHPFHPPPPGIHPATRENAENGERCGYFPYGGYPYGGYPYGGYPYGGYPYGGIYPYLLSDSYYDL
jgi:hypothetical protein